MSAQHTPGPWAVKFANGVVLVRAENGDTICNVCEYGPQSERPTGQAANARLIAAAPELLAALRTMVGNYIDTYGDEGDDAPESVKVALDAIASVAPKVITLELCPCPTFDCACKGDYCRLLGRNIK